MTKLIAIGLSLAAAALWTAVTATAAEQAPAAGPAPKRIFLLAGPKSHGPVGNGQHDYGWSVRLLKVMLDHSNVRDRVHVDYHLDGWPTDNKEVRGLEEADTIVVISDGRDGDKFSDALHLESDERVAFVEKQIKRGCGLVTFHFSTFTPEKYAPQVLDWTGGYFQWEKNGKRDWTSAITTIEAEVRPASPDHPVSRGVTPFTMKEEFYYNLRFNNLRFDAPVDVPAAPAAAPAGGVTRPLWVVPALHGREPDGDVVAWARQRPGGGRGFGTSCGHYYDNWKHDDLRKLVLNGIVWSAHIEVPQNGVEAKFYTHEQIEQELGSGGGAAGDEAKQEKPGRAK